jgi:glutamate racemase
MKIGFYDSGLGGLTILRGVQEQLPQYDYVYLGDTANIPFGEKGEDEIYEHTKRGLETLFREGALLVVIACNTASAETLRKLQDGFVREAYPDRKVLGVIIPTVETLVEIESKNALLIATTRTIDSKKYEKEIEKLGGEGRLHSVATPSLVPMIELHNFEEAFLDLKTTLHEIVGEVDALILGCTHYTVLKDHLRNEYGEVRVVSQDEIIPEKLETYLKKHREIEESLTEGGSIEIILSEHNERYDHIKKMFFNV